MMLLGFGVWVRLVLLSLEFYATPTDFPLALFRREVDR